MPGTLFVVATPIGNLDDITIRALRVLREVDVIAAEDTRRTAHLLARHGIATPTTSLHEHNEGKKAPALVARLAAGENIALVSDAGTPTVSDPGAGLVRAALQKGIRVEPIPGPSAAIAALSVSGLTADSFTFLGFPPTRPSDRKKWFQRLAVVPGVAIFYESPHRIEATLGEITELLGDKEALVARELTKSHEQLVIGPISAALGRLSSDRGEFTVVLSIGHKTENMPSEVEDADASRRATVARFAKWLDISPNQLYEAIEKLRNR